MYMDRANDLPNREARGNASEEETADLSTAASTTAGHVGLTHLYIMTLLEENYRREKWRGKL